MGCGSAYAEDLIWPAVELAEKAKLDYIGIDSLAERTLPMASLRRLNDPEVGYDLRLMQLIDELFTVCVKNKIKIVGNMGAANPISAGNLIASRLREHGLRGVRVATITGDDVTDWVHRENPLIPTLGKRINEMQGEIATANAYIGAEPIVEALEGGADIVVGGRLADPSIWLGPMIHEFGWAADDWEMKGFGQLCAHMLECGLNLTGGNFADPPYRVVEDLVHVGFPYADIYPDKAEAIIQKLPGTGGRLDALSAKGQLTWEIKNPREYLTPDVTADLTDVQVQDVGEGQVKVWGASGSEWPKNLRVLVGVLEGYIAEGEMTYSGLGAVERAKLGAEIIKGRIEAEKVPIDELRVDLIGINSAHASVAPEPKSPPHEVRLRIAGRTKDQAAAQWLSHATEYLYIGGPASGGGNRRSTRPVLGSYQTFIPREQVKLKVNIQEN
jgi:hypothetical protein